MSGQLRLDIVGYNGGYPGEESDIESNDSDWLGTNPLEKEYRIKDRIIILPAMAEREVFEETFRYKVPKEIKTKKSDARKAKHQASLQSGEATSSWKQPYSVFDDAKILKTLKDPKLEHLCLNEKLDLLMEVLPGRSFESLRERHRKWLKLIDHASIKKILEFEAQNSEQAKDYFSKRGTDPATKKPIVSQILLLPPKKVHNEADSQADSEDEREEDKSQEGRGQMTESQANLGKRVSDLEPVTVRQDIKSHVQKFADTVSPADTDEGANLLMEHLQWVSLYHQMPIKTLLDRIESDTLNLGSLRQQMCKFTVDTRVKS